MDWDDDELLDDDYLLDDDDELDDDYLLDDDELDDELYDDDDDWRDDVEDGLDVGVDPDDYDTEEEYIEALNDAKAEYARLQAAVQAAERNRRRSRTIITTHGSYGRMDPDLFGGFTNYDGHNKIIGRTEKGFFGEYVTYDNKGKVIGYSRGDSSGKMTHYDEHGIYLGSSSPDGCYVATCIYGSYDCPEVWTLRRYRDNTIAKSCAGRGFIRLYYAISPTIVRLFSGMKWFHKLWRPVLDSMVSRLRMDGVEDTPYDDIKWRGNRA